MRSVRIAWIAAAVTVLAIAGCSGLFHSTAEPVETVPEPVECPDTTGLHSRIADLGSEVDSLRRRLADLEAANGELRAQKRTGDDALIASEIRIASLEEQLATIEIELQGAVEEAVRSKSRVRSVNSQAVAISRIAEVRVELESALQGDDPAVAGRLQRAQDFLKRADAVLAEQNYAGAAFLAERAEDLVRQARTVREITEASERPVVPIIPPRKLLVLQNSNLRDGPGIEFKRVGRVATDSTVTGVARCRGWFQIETEDGLRAWIAGHLVR